MVYLSNCTLNDYEGQGVTIAALDVLCEQLARDLFAIAKFLFVEIWQFNDIKDDGRPPS